MTDSTDIIVGGPRRTRRPPVCRGYIVVAPTSLDDQMKVVLKNYSSISDYDVPATNWISQEAQLPLEGDVCVIFFDDEGDAWVLVGRPLSA